MTAMPYTLQIWQAPQELVSRKWTSGHCAWMSRREQPGHGPFRDAPALASHCDADERDDVPQGHISRAAPHLRQARTVGVPPREGDEPAQHGCIQMPAKQVPALRIKAS